MSAARRSEAAITHRVPNRKASSWNARRPGSFLFPFLPSLSGCSRNKVRTQLAGPVYCAPLAGDGQKGRAGPLCPPLFFFFLLPPAPVVSEVRPEPGSPCRLPVAHWLQQGQRPLLLSPSAIFLRSAVEDEAGPGRPNRDPVLCRPSASHSAGGPRGGRRRQRDSRSLSFSFSFFLLPRATGPASWPGTASGSRQVLQATST